MKTVLAEGRYVVSFNCSFGDFICGDDRAFSLDYAGNDIDELAAEVIAESMAGNPPYPMVFVRNPDEKSDVIGHFHHVDEDDDYCDAVMVPYGYF